MPLARSALVPAGRFVLLAGAALALAGPFFFDVPQFQLATEFLSLLVLAMMWNLLAGYADIVTVGQHGFVGVGAYALFAFAALLQLNPYVSVLLAGVTALVLAVPVMVII